MDDHDYRVLRAYERDMKNELSTHSPARAHFFEYIRSFRPSKLGVNAALKTLQMIMTMEQHASRPDRANIRACRIWMSAISQVQAGGIEQLLFVDLKPARKLESEFYPLLENDERSGLKSAMKRRTAVIVLTVCTVALFIGLVLFGKFNFWIAAILVFVLLNFGLWLILCVWRLAQEEHRLNVSRKAASGDLAAFLRHIRLRQISFSPKGLYRLFRLQLRWLLSRTKTAQKR